MLDIAAGDLIASELYKVVAPTEVCDGVNISCGTAKLSQIVEYLGFVTSRFGGCAFVAHGRSPSIGPRLKLIAV
ncbi:hypothetical protein ACIKP9_13480 [Methylobacillus methanolivorans]|uniref:Uncharacterized protein n=1 Tax=Methylobacillus methanolivorans TaxID=1848927 RepID=A0ABW8GPE1_9PROT